MRPSFSLLGYFILFTLICETICAPPQSRTSNITPHHAIHAGKTHPKRPDTSKHHTNHPHSKIPKANPHHKATKDDIPLPTVAECKDQLNVAKDTSLFYSGPGSYAGKAKAWIKADKSRKD